MKKATIVIIKKEYREPGEPAIKHEVIEHNGDRLIISPVVWDYPIKPRELVSIDMVEGV